MFPAISRPGLVARFAGAGHRPETPHALAGLGVVGVQKSANAVFGARNSDDDFVLDRQRRECDGVRGLVIGDFYVPADAAGLHVQRNQVGVQRADEQLVVERRNAAIHLAAANRNRRDMLRR